jgi:septal ring factor EnvC (AmiA/AmiB activator)
MAPTAVDRFSELENRIIRTIELVKTTRQEKAAVEKELAMARKNIERLEREVGELNQERDLVKNRVESLLDSLSEITEESVV